MATQSTQTLWHRRFARQAVRSASTEEAIRSGVVSLRVPRITPLVLDTAAPAYSHPTNLVELDIRSPTSPPPDFNMLEPSPPPHRGYTSYIPEGLEIDDFDEPFQGDFDFFDPGEDIRNHSETAHGHIVTTTVELPPRPNCNFAHYGLLPPHPDPGPTAPYAQAISYPQCDAVDCWTIERKWERSHKQGPYQDPSIPKELHGYLTRSLEAHGLKDLFQGDSIPPSHVWDALHRIIMGTAEATSGAREAGMSDWARVENFRAWHCLGHRSVEEVYDLLWTDEHEYRSERR